MRNSPGKGVMRRDGNCKIPYGENEGIVVIITSFVDSNTDEFTAISIDYAFPECNVNYDC
jgi:hypothetical protein